MRSAALWSAAVLSAVAQCKPAAESSVKQQAAAETEPAAASAHIVCDTERVSETGLQRLAASSSLRGPLQSAELQRILVNIDSASDRAARLDDYRHKNADFAAFIDQMLATLTGTADKQQPANDVDLDELLQTLAHATGSGELT